MSPRQHESLLVIPFVWRTLKYAYGVRIACPLDFFLDFRFVTISHDNQFGSWRSLKNVFHCSDRIAESFVPAESADAHYSWVTELVTVWFESPERVVDSRCYYRHFFR